jgi:hypothetical protein
MLIVDMHICGPLKQRYVYVTRTFKLIQGNEGIQALQLRPATSIRISETN